MIKDNKWQSDLNLDVFLRRHTDTNALLFLLHLSLFYLPFSTLIGSLCNLDGLLTGIVKIRLLFVLITTHSIRSASDNSGVFTKNLFNNTLMML